MREHDVRAGQVVAVLRVHRPGDDLAQPVESRQLDVFVVAPGEPLPYPVDIPFAGGYAVFIPVEIQLPPVQCSPIGRTRHRVDIVPVNHRVGEYHDDLALLRGFAQPRGGLLHGLFEGLDPVAVREIIVDQLLPLRLAGRFALVAQMPRLEGVEFCVGTVRVLEFQEDEPVEEPVLPALFIDIGDIGRQPFLVPQERGAVVAAAVT